MPTLTRRDFTATLAAAPLAAQRNRPNIILCMGDDHGWFETGYNGHPHVRTPVLDAMAAGGLRLDRFYSAHPNCSPTRGSIMTGRHPNRYGTFAPGWSIRPEEITIAQLLRQAGYATGHFGKWHLGPVKKDSPTSPGAMGFDEWVSHDNFYEVDPTFSRNGGPPETIRGESSAITVREARAFIDRAGAAGKPFFAVIWFGSPHEPYVGTQPYLDQYKGLGDPMRSRLAEITAMDEAIGALRTHLRDRGQADNTLLWYCGDNGVPPEGRAGMPLRGAKGDMYEGGTAVPCVIEWPARIPKARRSSANAVTSDMLPTLCELLGIRPPARPLDGVSLKPLLDGANWTRRRPIFFWAFNSNRESRSGRPGYLPAPAQQGTTPTAKLMDGKYTRDFRNFRHETVVPEDFDGRAAVLEDRFKLVTGGPRQQADAEAASELYDVRANREESKDLAGAEPKRIAAMREALRIWQTSVLQSLTGADYKSGA